VSEQTRIRSFSILMGSPSSSEGPGTGLRLKGVAVDLSFTGATVSATDR